MSCHYLFLPAGKAFLFALVCLWLSYQSTPAEGLTVMMIAFAFTTMAMVCGIAAGALKIQAKRIDELERQLNAFNQSNPATQL